MGKGEIARYEQLLLFLQCFQKTCFPGASKDVIVWEWLKDDSGAKISHEKYTHLLRLCQKKIKPKIHHSFYLLFPHHLSKEVHLMFQAVIVMSVIVLYLHIAFKTFVE